MNNYSFLDLTTDKVISVINKETGLALDPKQLTLTSKNNPSDKGTDKENDSILIVTPAAGSKYTGTKELAFRRFTSLSFLGLFGGTVAVDKTATSEQIWETIAVRYGLKVDSTVPGTIEWQDDKNGTMLVADGACFAIKDQMVIRLVPTLPVLADTVTEAALGPVRLRSNLDWTTNETFSLLGARFYGVDFTAWAMNPPLISVGTFTNEQVDSLVAFAKSKLPLNDVESKITGGLYGSTYKIVTTKAAEAYGANVDDYENVIVVSNAAWPEGACYLLHMNKIQKETAK